MWRLLCGLAGGILSAVKALAPWVGRPGSPWPSQMFHEHAGPGLEARCACGPWLSQGCWCPLLGGCSS